MRARTWIAVGAIAGLLAPIQTRRLARDVATRVAVAAAGAATPGRRAGPDHQAHGGAHMATEAASGAHETTA